MMLSKYPLIWPLITMKGEDKKTNTIKLLVNDKEDLLIIRYDIQRNEILNRISNNKEVEIIKDSAVEKPDLLGNK